ncbi:class I SAM-dependent methyltransferase [Schlesneria paludicola]|uniref:class I SAM-dependent methyltransferase n=1 Tax=Schlesneria paludicola TaxID=360056 RepID=UPI00029A4ADD|nr:class I SAM-dependent methyltransferase [Schlesneria paludicola]
MHTSYDAAAGVYDFVVDYRSRPDVPFFVEGAESSPGKILELGCGTGRVLIPVARAGCSIVGLDQSTEMLAVCKQKLRREPTDVQSRVSLIQGDMRTFELADRFSLIMFPFRPFQHLVEIDEQLTCLACARRHLNDDGRLVLDVFNPSLTSLTRDNLGRIEVAGPEFHLPDGRHVIHLERIVARDLIKQILSIELIYDVINAKGDTQRVVHAFEMRYFFRYELEHLFARAGFAIEATYGDYHYHPFSATHSNDMVFVLRKSL